MKIKFGSLFLGCVLVVAACAPAFGAEARVVDVQKVLAQSRASEAGRQHLAEARKILEQGYQDLQKAWEKSPQNERNAALAEGAAALNRQMAIEEQAVTNVISAMMLEEIKNWRAANKNVLLVLPRQNAFDADDSIDITMAIIGAMNKKQPKFAALPTVSVNNPPKQSPAVKLPPKGSAKPAAKKQQPKQPQ